MIFASGSSSPVTPHRADGRLSPDGFRADRMPPTVKESTTEVPASSEFAQSPPTARLADGSHEPSEQAIILAQYAKEAEGVIEAMQVQSLLRQTKGLSPF
jgi:hypothetical protein